MMISTSQKGQFIGSVLASMLGILAFLLGGKVRAEIQNDAIGFSTNHVLESSQAGENIDVMSGNLSLTIPLGPRYKLTDRFSYGVTLTYNSKIWEHDCTNTADWESCNGTLVAPSTYGLGFNIWPARAYKKSTDKSYVRRLVLNDGAEHFFCAGAGGPGCQYGSAEEQGLPTTLGTERYLVKRLQVGPTFAGYEVYPGDGTRMILGRVLNATNEEAVVTRIETIEEDGNEDAVQWVEYNYSGGDALSSIHDKQGREIVFGSSPYGGLEIRFQMISTSGGSTVLVPAEKAVYTLMFGGGSIKDPSDNLINFDNRNFLTEIWFPGLTSSGPNPCAPHRNCDRFSI